MLFYQTYLPSIRFSKVVARYMILTDEGSYAEWRKIDVVPNGLPLLLFSFGENLRFLRDGKPAREITNGNLVGIHDCMYAPSWKDPMRLFLIIFKPLGLYQLLKCDMADLKNDLINFNLLGLKESEWICEKLNALPAHEAKIAFIESWLEKKLWGRVSDYMLTDHITDKIIKKKGVVSIRSIASELHINTKYIERHFHHQLGLSPKKFAEIVRFTYLNTLLQQETVSLKELVYLGGFTDQSHLIKHFQRISGHSPKALVRMADGRPEAIFSQKQNIYELLSRRNGPYVQ